mmetsp:Transcript_23870/g.47687  ORF Transcript_23870/g.47687 Transcript_23870/m.47687 type:complete len:80 (+) Transcript_23870:588-827(+)
MGCASDVFVPEGPVLLVAMARCLGVACKTYRRQASSSAPSQPVIWQEDEARDEMRLAESERVTSNTRVWQMACMDHGTL